MLALQGRHTVIRDRCGQGEGEGGGGVAAGEGDVLMAQDGDVLITISESSGRVAE